MINPTLLYDGDVTEAGASWQPHIIKQINRFLVKEELDLDIQNQYVDLNNLGINYLEEFNELPEQSLIEMLDHINDHYFPILYMEAIQLHPQRLQTLGRYIYEILFVDMIKTTLPALENISTDPQVLKKDLVEYFSNKLKAFETIQRVAGQVNMTAETLKWTTALDIFDTDLTDFIDTFIIPVLDQYEDYIDLRRGV